MCLIFIFILGYLNKLILYLEHLIFNFEHHGNRVGTIVKFRRYFLDFYLLEHRGTVEEGNWNAIDSI